MKRFLKPMMVIGMVAAMSVSAFAKTASIKIGDNETKIDVSGFVQAAYISDQGLNGINATIGNYPLSNNDTFTLNRLQLAFAASPNNNIDVKTSVELGRNFSGINESRIVDAMVDLKYVPGVTFRVGQFALPLGLELEQDPYSMDFINYTVFTNLGAQRNRGIMAYGDISPMVSYELGVSNLMVDGSLTGARNASTSDGKRMFGRLSVTPCQNWLIAAMGAYEKYDNSATAGNKNKNALWALGSGYGYGNWGFAAVYGEMKMLNGVTTATTKARDYFGIVTYKIPQTSLQLVSRYEHTKITVTNAAASPAASIVTAGFNWDFDKNARLQIQREFWSSNAAAASKNDVTMIQLGVRF